MKKLWWLLPVALLAAGSLLFFGCGGGNNDDDDGDDDGGVWTDVFDLQEFLKENGAALGDTTTDKIFGAGAENDKTKPLSPAHAGGDAAAFKIVDSGEGKLGIEVTAIANWGPGFDLNFKGLGLRAGDKITIGGNLTKFGTKTGNDRKIVLNMDHSGWAPLNDWNPVLEELGEFDNEFDALTAADITKIKSANPQAIRIKSAMGGGEVFVIHTITVAGNRGGAVSDFDAITNISGIPSTVYVANSPITLSGTIEPVFATAKDTAIVWAVTDAGTTGGTIADGKLTVSAAGTVKISATVANGLTASTPYVQEFTITVSADAPPTEGDIVINAADTTSTTWAWYANDGAGLKGRLTADLAAEINAMEGGEVWLYVVSQNGTDPLAAGSGNGSFGGSDIKTNNPLEPAGEADDLIKITIPVGGFTLGTEPDEDKLNTLNINVWNNTKIIKIEVWAP